MDRIRVTWSGPGVAGPGLTTFYTTSGGMDPLAVLSFFDQVKQHLPDDVQLTIPSAGDVMSEVSGAITGSWAAPGGGVVSGTSSSTFALGQGVRIVWDTNGIRNGRHVRGSTFLAPVTAPVYDTTGRVVPAAQASITAAASAFRAAMDGTLVVWSRPKGVQGGILSPITSVQVPETPTALRSRRY